MANPKAHLYAGLFQSLFDGEINVQRHTFKAMLVGDGYEPDTDEHRYLSDVSDEIEGEGYESGGQALDNIQVDYDPNKKRLRLVGDDLKWSDSTFTARKLVVYDNNGSGNEDKPLVMCVDFGEAQSPSEGSFTVKWSSDGILYLDLA